ncbi:MAG: shikimate kinase [Cellvibrionaceae bacterium]|nr:shikimate kinase [Cellvibrionaceae bacterium]
MKRVIIFGNSGAGKSTLAKSLANIDQLAHFDLDSIAWLPTSPPQRKPVEQSKADIDAFMAENDQWVIEGCYSDLLELLFTKASEIIFLDLPIDQCITNARARPWEPHKYESKQAQDENLDMLLAWISDYEGRSDTFSRSSHQDLFRRFAGKKTRYTHNVGNR